MSTKASAYASPSAFALSTDSPLPVATNAVRFAVGRLQVGELRYVKISVRLLADAPATGIVMLTMLEDNDSLFAAMCAGARGYILKGADKAEVLKTIRAVAEGEALFGPAIAGRLTAFFQQSRTAERDEGALTPFPDLTERERDVLALIAAGENNQEIARRLHISAKTVSNHISNIFNKLQVADRAQAIVKARDAGLGKTSSDLSQG